MISEIQIPTATDQPEPKKRAQKRYTEKELVDRIDAEEVKIKRLREKAEIFDRFADVLREYPTQGKWLLTLRDDAEKLRKRANKIESVSHTKLKAALAKIRTGCLPGMGTGDPTVTL